VLLLACRKSIFISNAVALGCGFFIVRLLKWGIGTSRPNILFSQGIFTCHPFNFSPDYQSFPSSHTLAIFTIATSLGLFWPKYRVVFLVGAGILAMSRVILHQHYLSDVAFGAYIGWEITKKIGQVKLVRLND